MNSISLRPNVSFQNNDQSRISFSETMLKTGEALNNYRSNNLSGDHGYRFNGGMTYRHRFHNRGRTFSLNFDGASNVPKATANNSPLNHYTQHSLEQHLHTITQLLNTLT